MAEVFSSHVKKCFRVELGFGDYFSGSCFSFGKLIFTKTFSLKLLFSLGDFLGFLCFLDFLEPIAVTQGCSKQG